MRRMRARRNDFSPISRLPPEILSSIFALHAINQPALGQDPTDHPDDIVHCDRPPGPPSSLTPVQLALGWITITHVSRHWRQVVLSTPNLWVNIVFDLGAEWVEEMLERPKAASISYCRELSSRQREWNGKVLHGVTLRKHLSHVRRFKVSGDWSFLAATIRALILPVPHLESLELVLATVKHRSRRLRVTDILPSDLFSRQAPKLRHLTLVGCSIPWDSYLLRDLTHLEIHLLPRSVFPSSSVVDAIKPLTIPSMGQLLSILEAMPSLQVLILRNCLPPPDFTNRVVPLQYLTKLSLEGFLSQVVATLEHVSSLGSALLSLRCPAFELTIDWNRNFNALINLVTTHLLAPGTSMLSLSTLSLDYVDGMRGLRIVAWDKDVSLHLLRSESIQTEPPRLHLTLGCISMEPAEDSSLKFCKALPLKNLRAFSAYIGLYWKSADWAELSSLCPEVAHLRVDKNGAAELVHALMESAVFPALVTLGFKDVNFSPLPWARDQVALCNSVPVLLRTRRDAGVPVRRLELVACVYSSRDMCREFVDDVAWDDNLNEDED
ncbi:hypothetical protein BC827DRAFT_1223120 [Russula dissimulans]|nr:hypothetical protein BC827DRAFT_1223120 [Russula dissimulans]